MLTIFFGGEGSSPSTSPHFGSSSSPQSEELPPPPQHRAPCVYVVRAKGDPKEMGPGGHRGGGGRQGPGGWGPNEASPRRLVLRLGLDAASGGWGGTLRTGASGFARLGGRGAGQQSLAWLKSHFWRGKAKREAEETKPGGMGSCRAPSRARSGGRLVRTGTVGRGEWGSGGSRPP